jgi:hypothetical protein
MTVTQQAANPPLAAPAAHDGAEIRVKLGWLPWIVLSLAAGVMAVSGADALSRTGEKGASLLFWFALVLMIFPAALRLIGAGASPTERVATVVAVGLALYAVKVLRDPFGFTYGDEFPHLHNLQSILSTGRLFGSNSILPITPHYPGLELVAALIVHAGGVSPFAAGVLTVAAGRVLMSFGLYLLYVRLSGSPRAAGLGVLVYAATPNFLLWSGQFAYESLALPLATVALFMTIRWAQERDPSSRRQWEGVFAVVAAAVVVTHHVSAYVLVVFLVAICLLHWRLHGRRGAPWVLAGGTAALTLAWLTFFGGGTVGYISPVVGSAFKQVIQTLARETPTRTLFANQSGVAVTPFAEIVVALLGIMLLGLGVLAGLWLVWKRRWRNPLLVLLVLCSIAYLSTLPLRFVPDAWETASRAGDYLFIGVAMAVALGSIWLLGRGSGERQRRRLALAVAVTLVFLSGVIAGWPAGQRLAQPNVVAVAGRTLDPPGVVAATWSGRTLGPQQQVFAQDADARFFLVDGFQTAISGDFAPDVQGFLDSATLTVAERALLRRYRTTLVVSDRRSISSDNLFGFFFDVGAPSLLRAVDGEKFDVPKTDRVFDSGDIVIYGVRGLW